MEYSARYPSPVGILTLTGEGERLTGLWLGTNVPRDFPPQGDASVFSRARVWLDAYFRGQPAPIDFSLDPAGTDFQKRVWKILLDIPWGSVRTYGDIAKEIAADAGKDRMSSQAVGGAVGRNPISIIIPCHRVVGARGQLTGYAGGLKNKSWLLHHEGWLQEETL